MSTPLAALTGQVVTPAVPGDQTVAGSVAADGKSSVVAKLAEIIKDMITRGGVYHSEEAQRLALEVVDDFKRVFSAGSGLVLETYRAPWEDVSKRPSASGAIAPAVPAGFAIDYDQLAAALLRAQQKGVTG